MSITEKIIELLPEEMSGTPSQRDERDAYNQALQDVKEKLPEILKLIREEVKRLPRAYGNGFDKVDRHEVLELLK